MEGPGSLASPAMLGKACSLLGAQVPYLGNGGKMDEMLPKGYFRFMIL
jgi:hypothetical protein